jgi:hypothetical protein
MVRDLQALGLRAEACKSSGFHPSDHWQGTRPQAAEDSDPGPKNSSFNPEPQNELRQRVRDLLVQSLSEAWRTLTGSPASAQLCVHAFSIGMLEILGVYSVLRGDGL